MYSVTVKDMTAETLQNSDTISDMYTVQLLVFNSIILFQFGGYKLTMMHKIILHHVTSNKHSIVLTYTNTGKFSVFSELLLIKLNI